MKAMILAAGRGERMRPLTDEIPKPLVSIGEHNLIERHVLLLREAGVREIVINISYRAQQIMDALGDGRRYGVDITYSYEGETALGTGQGIYRVLHCLGEAPFLVVSADIVTDFSYKKLADVELSVDQDALLLMVPNPSHHMAGDFGVNDTGVLDFVSPRMTYGCIAVLRPSLFVGCEPGFQPIAPFFKRAITAGRAYALRCEDYWVNIGTEAQLQEVRERYVRA